MLERIIRARLLLLALTTALSASGGFATVGLAETTADDATWLKADLTGKYVWSDGSEGQFLQDYNQQSGVDATLDARKTWDDGSYFHLRGLGQSGESQGWAQGEYDSLKGFEMILDFSYWTEYYNNRDGGPNPDLFPFTNDGGVFYGNGLPATNWLTSSATFDLQIDEIVHDVYGEFRYRKLDGDQTLLKGGTLDGVQIDVGGGPGVGPIDFRFPGRKSLDQDGKTAMLGARTGLLGINWQTDISYQYHDIQSSTFEPSYCTSAASPPGSCGSNSLAHLDRFSEATKLQLVKYDIAGSRNVSSNLFLFGAGFFSWERSDPQPDQFVSEASVFGFRGETRTTSSARVTRFTPAASFGGVYRATRNLLVRADTQLRAHIQSGDLSETRDESPLVSGVGDFSRVTNTADRDAVISTTRLEADWKVRPRVTVSADARYQYRWDDVNSRQETTLPGDRPEIEQYTQNMSRLKLGPSIRYKMRKGRSVQGGYDFSFVDVSQDINEISNQYNVGDYDLMRHHLYLKAGGRVSKKLRGELRAQYSYETREMDGAVSSDALGNIFNPTSSAEVRMKGWSVVPMLRWRPQDHWSLYGSYSISQRHFEPKSGDSFDYKVLTNALSSGATYRPSDSWSVSGSYTLYHNSQSVQNTGHNASLSGSLAVSEDFAANGAVRYLSFNQDATSLDDYNAVVVSLGLEAKF
ncbi:MAG TPA: hypothetical protein EYQ54_14890 [Myxococcales bacterium]|nr:hypothetical protein [Myxococcales bacterium]